jgi:hypothetical protein
VVKRIGSNNVRYSTEGIHLSAQDIGELYRRPDEETPVRQPDHGHPRRIMKSEYHDVGSIRDPDLVTELLQHVAASSRSDVICFADCGGYKPHEIGKRVSWPVLADATATTSEMSAK